MAKLTILFLIRNGETDLTKLKEAHSDGVPFGDSEWLMEVAIKTGSVELCNWLYQQGITIGKYKLPYARAGGEHLDLCEWILSINYRISQVDFAVACEKCDIKLCKWLLEHEELTFGGIFDRSLHNAAKSGSIELCSFLLEKGFYWTEYSYTVAIHHAHLDLCKWADEKGFPLEFHQLYEVGTSANIPMLEWLITKGREPMQRDYYFAAIKGNIETMEWLKAKGIKPTQQDLKWAAKYGQFESCKWLFNEGLVLNKAVFRSAIAGESVPIMEWLKEQGCPINSDIIEQVFATGAFLKSLQWLETNYPALRM